MNIAIISEHASPINAIGGTDSGGQNVYVAQLAKHLVRRGHTVDVYTRRDSASLPMIMDLDEGYRLINVPAGPPAPVPKEQILPFMKDFTDFLMAFMKTTSTEYDVVHGNFWMSGLVAADLKQQLNIPFAITFHALGRVRRLYQRDNDKFPDQRFEIEDRVVREADLIIAECPQDYEDLLQLYEADENKITIIPCGFDENEMHPVSKTTAREEIGIDKDMDLILHLGRMVPRKGADNVIRGFSHYLKETRKKTKLLIVGGETEYPDPVATPEIGRLQLLAKEEGVSDHVIFTGQRNRRSLKHYFSAADVFVTTPWYEPFGITPVEAMACGTPVIGSSVGGIKYTVRHGVTGLLVPPEDPIALKNALSGILKDVSIRNFFSRKSIERANLHFRWDIMARKMDEAITNKIFNKKNEEFMFNVDHELFIPMNIEGVHNAITKSVIG